MMSENCVTSKKLINKLQKLCFSEQGRLWEQLLGGSASRAVPVKNLPRVAKQLLEFGHWVLHARAAASQGRRRILKAPPYLPTSLDEDSLTSQCCSFEILENFGSQYNARDPNVYISGHENYRNYISQFRIYLVSPNSALTTKSISELPQLHRLACSRAERALIQHEFNTSLPAIA